MRVIFIEVMWIEVSSFKRDMGVRKWPIREAWKADFSVSFGERKHSDSMNKRRETT
jgi:hypothetical protein